MRAALVSGGSLLLSGLAAGQSVWIVDDDGGPGADFTEIQPAVDAAGEGDTIVIREGTYLSFAITGKSLTVTADLDAFVRISHPTEVGVFFNVLSEPSTISVSGLSANQRVLLRGIVVDAALAGLPSGVELSGLVLRDNAGSVWIEECSLPANTSGSFSPNFEIVNRSAVAVLAENCASVVLARCEVLGGVPNVAVFDYSAPEGALDDLHGLLVRSSVVAAYDSLIYGGVGAHSKFCFVSPGPGGTILCPTEAWRGGDGVHVESGSFYAAGCEFRGGDGMTGAPDSVFNSPTKPGDGGDGLEVSGVTGSVRLLDCELFAGLPGAPAFPPGNPGESGTVLVDPLGLVDPVPGRSFPLWVSSPLAVGEPGLLAFEADPGDLLFLGASGASVHVPLAPFSGVLHLAPPGLSFFVGLAPASGSLELPLTLAALDPSVDATAFLLQSVALTTGGGIVLGAPSALVGVN